MGERVRASGSIEVFEALWHSPQFPKDLTYKNTCEIFKNEEIEKKGK